MQQGAELQSLNTSPSAAMSLQATVISFEAVKGVKESFTVRKCTFTQQLLCIFMALTHGLLSTLDSNGDTQNYKIQVTREGVVYTVRRRYSDFLALDKNVQKRRFFCRCSLLCTLPAHSPPSLHVLASFAMTPW